MEVTYFFDPACPFTWRTSRWLRTVAESREVTLRWRALSLSILNDGQDVPEQYRAPMAASARALRLVEALRADDRHDTAGDFYTELGMRTHDSDTPLTDDIVQTAAEVAGIADAKAVLDDPSWDEAVRGSHETALALAGPGVGSPVLHVEGATRGLHGPIIGVVPPDHEALAIWDAVVPLMRIDTFFEIKRGRS